MSEITSIQAAGLAASCEEHAAEWAAALKTALDGDFTIGAAEQGTYQPKSPPPGFDGPGLLLLLASEDVGFAIVLPATSAALPPWCAAPDASGAGKLSTLAQELGALALPDKLKADSAEARWVPSLSAALAAGGVASDGSVVTLEVASGATTGKLNLIWPLSAPAHAYDAATSAARDSWGNVAPNGPSGNPAEEERSKREGPPTFDQLPHYSRSLLKILIPVSVELASKKETVKEVVELVPGSIIKFEKGCDELLQMVIGGQSVAEGEAVKIGDKFGFRVTGLLMPREHFIPVQRRAG